MTDRVPDEWVKEALPGLDMDAIAARYDAAFRDRDRQSAAAWESARDVPALVAAVAVLRAQRDAALAALDAAVAEQDAAATEATAKDADSPAAASMRGRAGGVYLAAEAVRAALGVQPEPAEKEQK